MSRRRHVINDDDNLLFDGETEELNQEHEILLEPLLDSFDSFPRIRGWSTASTIGEFHVRSSHVANLIGAGSAPIRSIWTRH